MIDDSLLRNMCDQGYSWSEIGAAVGLTPSGAQKRASSLSIPKAACKPGTRPKHRFAGAYCQRCGIFLTAAPPGQDGLCGWCCSPK